jgi:poly-gamma-glutamate synthesis protein (capsule biosynthesis protein)
MTSRRVAILFAAASLAAACASAPTQQTPQAANSPAPAQTSSAAPDGSFTMIETGNVLIHPALTDQAAVDA